MHISFLRHQLANKQGQTPGGLSWKSQPSSRDLIKRMLNIAWEKSAVYAGAWVRARLLSPLGTADPEAGQRPSPGGCKASINHRSAGCTQAWHSFKPLVTSCSCCSLWGSQGGQEQHFWVVKLHEARASLPRAWGPLGAWAEKLPLPGLGHCPGEEDAHEQTATAAAAAALGREEGQRQQSAQSQ